MRHYELVVVLSPMISPDEAGRAWERIKGFLTNREAEIVHEERWGTRRLAYPVRKGQYQFLEGNYCLARFATERTFNIDLETYLKLDDQVLRSLVTATLPEADLAAHAAQTRAPRPPRPAPGAGPAGGAAPPRAPAAAGAGAPPSRPAAAAAGTPPSQPAAAGAPPPQPADGAAAPPPQPAAAGTPPPQPAADAPAVPPAPAPEAAAAPPDNPQPEQPPEQRG